MPDGPARADTHDDWPHDVPIVIDIAARCYLGMPGGVVEPYTGGFPLLPCTM